LGERKKVRGLAGKRKKTERKRKFEICLGWDMGKKKPSQKVQKEKGQTTLQRRRFKSRDKRGKKCGRNAARQPGGKAFHRIGKYVRLKGTNERTKKKCFDRGKNRKKGEKQIRGSTVLLQCQKKGGTR